VVHGVRFPSSARGGTAVVFIVELVGGRGRVIRFLGHLVREVDVLLALAVYK